MKKIVGVLLLVLVAVAAAWTVSATEGQKSPELSIAQLMSGIKDYEKKKITLQGVSVGTCASGGKMWISEGEYKEGAAVVLVRAKDDAFKFDRKAVGKDVRLQGFPLAYYADYCSSTGEKEAGTDTKTAHSEEMKGREGDLKGITFIAESIEYL